MGIPILWKDGLYIVFVFCLLLFLPVFQQFCQIPYYHIWESHTWASIVWIINHNTIWHHISGLTYFEVMLVAWWHQVIKSQPILIYHHLDHQEKLGVQYGSVAHFTNSFSITIQMWQQGSWEAVLCDAPKILAILDHFYHPELLRNWTEARS